MKNISVPYLPELAGLGEDRIIELMEHKATRQSIDQANWPEYSYKPISVFTIAHDGNSIYIHYFIRGNCLRALYTEDQSPVWTDSCVEFFVQPPIGPDYYNFEFNCIGTCYAAKRRDRNDFTLLSTKELQQIKRYPSVGRKPFQEMGGLFAWELLVEIPFSLIGLDNAKLPEQIRANFYKCADGTILPHYLSWNPIETPKPDFHRPEYFGELFLEMPEKEL